MFPSIHIMGSEEGNKMNDYLFFYHTMSDGGNTKTFSCKTLDFSTALSRLAGYFLSLSDFSLIEYQLPPLCYENGLFKTFGDNDIKFFLNLVKNGLNVKDELND